jgi:hypothetical protein
MLTRQFQKNLSIGPVAAVASDSNGNFLGASALTIAGATEPEMLEAVRGMQGGTCPGKRSLLAKDQVGE